MMLFLTMNILLSFSFIFMMHPLSMGLTLLMQTITVALITGFLNTNFWFSYILFLIMIGGMLVLFIYMTSVASNEKFKFNKILIITLILMVNFSLILILNMDMFMSLIQMINFEINSSSNNLKLSKFYNKPSNMIMFMMIIYLFITLIAVVKITDFKSGPLRQNF
uniref:NADH dehydrogenase subunit 6 n=1 Tax=Ochthebius subinteger TaxID=1309363 RepID=UPI002E7985E3|nr:NADH dehydrogenase subunit 6 [Ochthebius subinteger]WPM98443.1 NADH dehydrogenase subunit 6 [Ochthebius subinteger]